ncbi:alpha/beta hydrolase, partial [Planococcus sp. A6]|nr:alpha/beta hydrolase [Planococcus sp. A6]
MKRKRSVSKKILALLAAAFLASAGFVLASQLTEEQKAAPIIGSAIYSPPPNFAEVASHVEVVKDIRYHASDNAFMDLYYPADATGPLPVILWIHGGG